MGSAQLAACGRQGARAIGEAGALATPALGAERGRRFFAGQIGDALAERHDQKHRQLAVQAAAAIGDLDAAFAMGCVELQDQPGARAELWASQIHSMP